MEETTELVGGGSDRIWEEEEATEVVGGGSEHGREGRETTGTAGRGPEDGWGGQQPKKMEEGVTAHEKGKQQPN